MAERDKPHLRVEGFARAEGYSPPPGGGGRAGLPVRERASHGNRLLKQYQAVLERAGRSDPSAWITDEPGLYIRVVGAAEVELPLDRLDNTAFTLCSLESFEDHEEAVVFVPSSRRNALEEKIRAYLNPDRDKRGSGGTKNPSNRQLVDSIEEIRFASLADFWTSKDPFPQSEADTWWEVWVRRESPGSDSTPALVAFCERVGAELGSEVLDFFDRQAFLLNCSAHSLEAAVELLGTLAELRSPETLPSFHAENSVIDQVEWAKDLVERTTFAPGDVGVAILDSGVNYNNLILSSVVDPENCVTMDEAVGLYTEPKPPGDVILEHGSAQAGIVAYGDLQKAVESSEEQSVNLVIESGRFSSLSAERPYLYGDLCRRIVEHLEGLYPERRRVISLSVTIPPELPGAQSSWSAELDQICFGAGGDAPRLAVVSAGNIGELTNTGDHIEGVLLSEIEDPAQAYNCLSVGAYADIQWVGSGEFAGWKSWAAVGDAAPSTRSSVAWANRRSTPIKPDVVAPGGNRIVAEGDPFVSDHDDTSWLTTSGRADGPVFDVNRDTSLATALVSRMAAQISLELDDLWPESIRALLVHSANWTPVMLERLAEFRRDQSDKAAKETLLRIVGYGVPDLSRAIASATNSLTLISQTALQPFTKRPDDRSSTDPRMGEMHWYDLPWPKESLEALGDQEVRLRVTLSYFVEPNPTRRGYRSRYSYASHGLRFRVQGAAQTMENFLAVVNRQMRGDEFQGSDADTDGWCLGPRLSARGGSLHSDWWTGTAAELASMQGVAIFPVGGWWKYKAAGDRWKSEARYALVVTIESDSETADVYSEVEAVVSVDATVSV